MDYNNFKKLSEVLRAHLVKAVAQKSAREAYLYRIVDNFQKRSEIERPKKFQAFVDFSRIHQKTFKYIPNAIDGIARKEVGVNCDSAKRGFAPDFLPALLFYEWTHDRSNFDSMLRDARDEISYAAYFLDGSDGRRASTKKGLMRQVDANARVGMKLIDWEVANRRVYAEMRKPTGTLSVFNLLIDSLPEQALYFSHLKQLDIHSTLITTLKPLSNLTNLIAIDFSYNQIDSLDGLQLTNIIGLFCGVTGITDLAPLGNAAMLQHLFCGSTYVADLTPLQHCAELQILCCDDTNVSSLQGLESCSKLLSLDCSDTYVSNLDPICDLPALREVVLNGCHIDGSLERLCSLPMLNSVVFFQGSAEGIPAETLSRESYEDCLPRLREFYRQRDKRAEAAT